MAIKDRNLTPGTRLRARYKREMYSCEVVETEAGVRFRLADGREFMSVSGAGAAVMGGIACNGWLFWSCEDGSGPAKPGPRSDKAKPVRKDVQRSRQLRKLPNQRGLAAGQERWWCSACMTSFMVESGAPPSMCPKGHPAQEGNVSE